MKSFRPLLVGALLAPIFCSGLLVARDKSPNFREWKLGNVLVGEKVTTSDTRNKVVVIEHWSPTCPRCIRILPHIAEIERRNRSKGLCVIGCVGMNNTKEQIEPILKQAKVEYPNLSGAGGPLSIDSIPYVFVFSRKGELVYKGDPASEEFEATIRRELREKNEVVPAAGDEAIAAKPTVTENVLVPRRIWTNSSGAKIEAAVQQFGGNTVTFLMPNGREVNYPIDKLSEESQAIIRSKQSGS